MDVKTTISSAEVVDTVHYMEKNIVFEIGEKDLDCAEVTVTLLYNNLQMKDNEEEVNTLTEIQVEKEATTRDCVADDVMTKVEDLLAGAISISKEEAQRIGDEIDKKIEEVLIYEDIRES